MLKPLGTARPTESCSASGRAYIVRPIPRPWRREMPDGMPNTPRSSAQRGARRVGNIGYLTGLRFARLAAVGTKRTKSDV
jgi:hypothetical protein